MSRIDEITKAFASLNANMDDAFKMRAVNRANEMTNEIKASQLKESDKISQIQQVAQALAPQLMGVGVDATEASRAAEAFDPMSRNKSFQNALQMATNNMTPQQMSEYAQNYLTQQTQVKQQNAQQKVDSKTESNSFRDSKFIEEQFQKFNNQLNTPDKVVRSALGKTAQTKQQALNLRALIGRNTQDGDLDKIPLTNLKEAVSQTALIVGGGAAPTEGQIKEFFPSTTATEVAQLKEFLSSKPQDANAGKFVKLFMKVAAREQTAADTLINRFVERQGLAFKKAIKTDPARAKSMVAQAMNVPEDELDVQDGVIVHGPSQKRRNMRSRLFKAAPKLLAGLNSKDKAKRAQAESHAKKIGLNPNFAKDLSLESLRNEMNGLILMDTVPAALGAPLGK